MRKRNLKRVLTLVLALALMFSLSMGAFADWDGEVEIIVRTASYDLTTHQYSYTQIADLTNVGISVGDTVKDAINREFVANWSGSFLHGLTVNNVFRGTVRYTPYPGSFDADGYYLGGDPIIDSLNQLPEFIAVDGVYMSCESIFGSYWAGVFLMGDMQHICSITHDWVYEVDYAADGYGNFVSPPSGMIWYDAGTRLIAYDCELSDGDIVRLTYGLTYCESYLPVV